MKHKVLMIASVPSMIGQFNMENLIILQDLDYEIEIACDLTDTTVWTEKRTEQFQKKLNEMKINYHQINFSRNALDFRSHMIAYQQVKTILSNGTYHFIHCHTPIASAIARILCHKYQIPVIYTAHGFHFYKNAPFKNWLLFYPIESWLSKYTDVLITINTEDYERAKKRFKAKQIEYVPGVGVDINKFQFKNFDRDDFRQQLGFHKEDLILISVGELSKRKNHVMIMKALAEIKRQDVHYVIAGTGQLENYLLESAKNLKLEKQFHLLGYRTDIPELMNAADIFVFPSLQEGLPVALMEAMACGLPCLASDIRGNKDILDNGEGGYLFSTDTELSNNLMRMLRKRNQLKAFGIYNRQKIAAYRYEVVSKQMKEIYERM